MTTTALIAEDEPLLAQALAAELARLWPALDIVARAGDGDTALASALRLQPDICFLDIRMPGLSGLEAAQALAEDWPDDGRSFPLLVFVTAYDQYALHAFDAQAVDYLVKPVQPARLADCVQRLQARLGERERPVAVRGDAASAPMADLERALAQVRALLPVAQAAPAAPRLEVIQASVGQTVHLVPVDDVVYFEAADKYVRVVTSTREYLIRLPLRDLMPQLDPQLFWQVHRSLLVRARAIERAERLETGKLLLTLRGRTERLTVSRLYAHLFKSL